MIIDTHSHLNFKAYKNDLDEVVKRTLAENIWLINVGSKYETSKQAVEIAEKYGKGIFAAIGLHPIFSGAEFVKIKTDPGEGEFLAKEQNFEKEKYKELAKSRKVVAIGEIGLDYYYRPKTKAKLEHFKARQKKVFTDQLDFARELGLPVILHCRMAHNDLLDIFKNYQLQTANYKLAGVVHCFTGTPEDAREYLNLDLYLGFNGIIFKMDLDEVIKICPPDKILVETDCPYLTPPQEEDPPKDSHLSGSAPNTRSAGIGRRNEPIFIKHIVQKIADLKGMSFDEVAEATAQNAKKLFRI